MPGVFAPNQTGRREWLMNMLFLADRRQTVFMSMARKAKPSKDEKTGIPNSQIGTYFAKVLGDLKPGGVADGQDVKAFDNQPNRDPISFRPEWYRRNPMVGTLAKDENIAGVTDAGSNEWEEAVGDQMILHKRDMEKESLSDQDSTLNGGAEGGTTMRGAGRWVNDGTLAWAELPVPAGARTPAAQIFTGAIGDGIATGLTEDAAQALMQARWDNTGDSGQLVGLLGTAVKNRFGLFTKYKPNISGATVIVRTEGKDFTSGELDGSQADVYYSDWGGFTLMPVPTVFLPDQYRGYLFDMEQIDIRSRFWTRERPLPDLGGGPRETIESFIANIFGDLRSHCKIAATA